MFEQLEPFKTLSILYLIKDAHQKHGLRHGDYLRYRGYCSRRIRRIRKSLSFTNSHKTVSKHSSKFVYQKVIADIVSDSKYLQIVVFDAERCWSHAMQLRQEIADDIHSRKRFHVIWKLKRAVMHTSNLDSIVKVCDRADTVTKLESQAYNAWMHGILFFELKRWKTALEHLNMAKTIYQKLAEAVKIENLIDLYESKCKEIQAQLRYCEFNCSLNTADSDAMSEMLNLQLKLGDDETLQDDFSKLLCELRTKASIDQLAEVMWGSKKILVSSSAVKQLLSALQQFGQQIKSTESNEIKISLYEQTLSNIRDVIQSLNDDLKKHMGDSNAQGSAQAVLPFIEFTRLSKSIEKYLLLIQSARQQTERKCRPQDLIRLYDTVLENCREVMGLNGAENTVGLIEAYKLKLEYYRSFRCYYIAEAYTHHHKWQEAILMYDHSLCCVNTAKQLIVNTPINQYILEHEIEMSGLDDLLAVISSSKLSAQADRILASVNDSKGRDTVDKRPLIETLDEYRSISSDDLIGPDAKIPVFQLPPNFIPMPNKPLFFDLALNYVQMPNLEEKISHLSSLEASSVQPSKKRDGTSKRDGGKEKGEGAEGLSELVKGWFWSRK